MSGPRHQSEINIEMFEVQFWIYIQTINKIFVSVRKTIYSTFSIPEISTIGAHRKPYKNSKNNNVICGAINERKPTKQKIPTWRQLEILAFYNHMKDTKRKNECKKIVESFQREFSDLSSLSARKWRDVRSRGCPVQGPHTVQINFMSIQK